MIEIPHMICKTLKAVAVILTVAALSAAAKLSDTQKQNLPPASPERVDFARDIKPILDASCTKCHGRGKHKGDFKIDDREAFLKGGETGAAAVPGHSSDSYLIELVTSKDPDTVMPKKGSKLTARQVGLLRAWIDQGVPWDPKINFARVPPANMTPRLPVLNIQGGENPIDGLLRTYFKTNRVAATAVVDDRIFARRVYLDIVGILPPPEELDHFLASREADKRARLVRRLLSDRHGYAQHWLTFWNDALRNDYRGTGYIDGGRKQISAWLYRALVTNMPYDRFVAELVNPTAESEGFAKGIVWRGVVNASQVPPMQAAQNISQVFMGVNLKCASCHDSFINDWTLADAYSLANVYANEPLTLFQCDKPTGENAGMRFIFPELGSIRASTNKQDRLRDLATVMISEKNGRLPRTIVNRLWARLMGRGLVEPVDEMENPAWHADLLDWLAEDFVRQGYDVKKTLERMMTSRAYQMPAITPEDGKKFVFRGPSVRRMSAEQFRDALTVLTGEGYSSPGAEVDLTLGGNLQELPLAAKWIWNQEGAAEKAKPETVSFRKTFVLREKPSTAHLILTCDNSFIAFLNGEKIGSGEEFAKLTLLDIGKHVRVGTNVLAISAVNDPKSKDAAGAEAENPAGLLVYARLRQLDTSRSTPVEKVSDFVSDSSWKWSLDQTNAWEKLQVENGLWSNAKEIGEPGAAPWNLGGKLEQTAAMISVLGKVRASLVAADPLLVALGRPNREQVVTSRPTLATTLQALELTNGDTLSRLVKKGAARRLSESSSTETLVTHLYRESLGRMPDRDELQTGAELVGKPANPEGAEDLLWTMVMLPEFQLIY